MVLLFMIHFPLSPGMRYIIAGHLSVYNGRLCNFIVRQLFINIQWQLHEAGARKTSTIYKTKQKTVCQLRSQKMFSVKMFHSDSESIKCIS